jgi:hypothetical protein
MKPDWLEQVWMEVMSEIEYESANPQEDMSGPRQDWKRQCEEMADAWGKS